jgi:4-amino-4-deoxy-L-arabinose transferase-like glycosyltransferase
MRGLAMWGTLVVLGVPVTFFLTIALLPLWGAIERRFGIESVGHSGPAGWCFWAVFLLYLGGALAVTRLARMPQR